MNSETRKQKQSISEKRKVRVIERYESTSRGRHGKNIFFRASGRDWLPAIRYYHFSYVLAIKMLAEMVCQSHGIDIHTLLILCIK